MNRQQPFTGYPAATYFFRREKSAPECLRHSRGKKSLTGQKDGRHFAPSRETGIFPAKNAFHPLVCSRQAKLPRAISTPRLELWGNFPAGRRRQRRNRPFAVNQHKENGDSTPPIRRRRKTLTAFFAWRRGTACFAAFFTPKKGSGRTHPRTGCTIPFCGQTAPKICESMSADESTASSRLIAGSQPLLYAHKRGEKALLFHLPSRGKRNCHGQFRRRGLGRAKIPGWPAPASRVLSPRDLYGTFCPGPI